MLQRASEITHHTSFFTINFYLLCLRQGQNFQVSVHGDLYQLEKNTSLEAIMLSTFPQESIALTRVENALLRRAIIIKDSLSKE